MSRDLLQRGGLAWSGPPRGANDLPDPKENGFWLPQEQRTTFGAPAAAFGETTGVVARGVWRSAIFDLKPYFKSEFSNSRYRAVPISAPGAILRLQVRGLATAHAITEIWSFQEGHLSDPGALTDNGVPYQYTSRENVSADFYDSASDVSILEWTPPDAVRFWRVNAVFDQIDAGVTPVFYCLAGLY